MSVNLLLENTTLFMTDILSPLCYGKHVGKPLHIIYTSRRCRATSTFIWSRVSFHLMNVSPVFTLFLAPFFTSTKIKLLNATFYSVADFVYVQFGAGQVAYCEKTVD